MKQREEQAQALSAHIGALLRVNCAFLKTEPVPALTHTDSDWYCNSCWNQSCRKQNTFSYGCNEAYRWSGKYVFFCPEGFTFVAASLSNEQGSLAGGFLVGPFFMGEEHDLTEKNAGSLPVIDTVTVHHIEEVLSAVARSICSVSPNIYGVYEYAQDKLLSELYKTGGKCKDNAESCSFIINSEKKLCDLIVSQDKEGAQKLLNELLGHIYFTGEADIASIKARLIELLVQLSRAAISAGAEGQEILLFNKQNIGMIEDITSIEELSAWITGIMHRFIQYSFDFKNAKHSDVLYKVIQYIKANYNKRISLEDIASHIYLSRSYISSLFKEETGESLFCFINRIRIEKSKALILNYDIPLVDVGGLCGYDDQSYFTKVFKNIVGVSPKKYRDRRGRIL